MVFVFMQSLCAMHICIFVLALMVRVYVCMVYRCAWCACLCVCMKEYSSCVCNTSGVLLCARCVCVCLTHQHKGKCVIVVNYVCICMCLQGGRTGRLERGSGLHSCVRWCACGVFVFVSAVMGIIG